MEQTLLLNATYEPLKVVHWQKAITLWCQGKVEIIASHDREVRVLLTMRHPRVVVFGNLLSAEECDELIAAATPHLKRSLTVETQTGGEALNEARTSDGMFFRRGENAIVSRIEARIARLLNWPLENGEGLQVLHYRPGAEYKPHYDYFDPAQSGTPTILKRGGQRVGTHNLRHGDVIWVWGWLLQVVIDEGDAVAVRGDDVWITVRRSKDAIKAGMRLALDTPTGPFSFRLSQEAIDAGLARAPGFGPPARKSHPKGDLYVRLVLENRPLNPVEMLKKFRKAA